MRLLFKQGPYNGQVVDITRQDLIDDALGTGFAELAPDEKPAPPKPASRIEVREAAKEEMDTEAWLNMSVKALKRRLGGVPVSADDLVTLIAAELAGRNRDTAVRALKQARDKVQDQHAVVGIETPE